MTYANPIGAGLRPERIDQGVDYGGSGPLYAVGDGTIVNLTNPGWPGGTFLCLHLATGQYVYYAEDITVLVALGQKVTAGQHIATATGGPSGIEIGFAAPPGTGESMARLHGQTSPTGDPGSVSSAYGKLMSDLIASLGGPAGILQGPVTGTVPANYIVIGGGPVASAQGIDVSSFQPVLTSTFGKSFIFVKATEGLSWRDPNFAANWKFLGEQVKAGKIAFRGAYHFFHPSLPAVAQARFFMSVVKAQGLTAGDVLMDDMEILSGEKDQLLLFGNRSHQLLQGRNNEAITRAGAVDYPELKPGTPIGELATSAVDAANKSFLDEVASLAGSEHHVINYSDLSVASQLPSSTSYPLFIAYYASSAPSNVHPWSKWLIWQWAGGGGPAGADQDAFNGTEAELKAWAGTVTPPPPPPTNITYLTAAETEAIVAALPVLNPGVSDAHLPHWYVRRVQATLNDIYGAKLTVDGNYGPASQAAVKSLIQKPNGLTQNAVVDKNTWSVIVTGTK